MTRVPRGYIARRRRTKMRSFASNFRGAHLRLNRMITQQVKRAFVSSHRDRGRQKRRDNPSKKNFPFKKGKIEKLGGT